jgi:four helix bundle protein
METYRRLEDLVVYQKLCRLHIEIGERTQRWPAEEKYELGSQARRSSNSAPAQLAEKYDDRHVRNKIEGVNRSRGESAETVHHLYIAYLKGYETQAAYEEYRARYQECIRMLNGMERTLERQLPEAERRWPNAVVREAAEDYDACPPGFPEPQTLNPKPQTPNPEPRTPNPEP